MRMPSTLFAASSLAAVSTGSPYARAAAALHRTKWAGLHPGAPAGLMLCHSAGLVNFASPVRDHMTANTGRLFWPRYAAGLSALFRQPCRTQTVPKLRRETRRATDAGKLPAEPESRL